MPVSAVVANSKSCEALQQPRTRALLGRLQKPAVVGVRPIQSARKFVKVQCFHCLKAGVLRPHACLSSHSQPAVIQLLKNKPLRHNKCSRSVFSAAEKMEPIDSAQIQGNADRKERASEPADDHLSPQDHEDKETDSVGVKIALSALRFYKREISPILPPSCRFIPTCSEYAMDSFKQHGVRKGFILTSWRLLRCNPFGPSGYDPVMWPPPGLEWMFRADF